MVATKSIKWGLGIAVIRGSGPALPLFSQTATNCAPTVSPIVHKLYHWLHQLIHQLHKLYIKCSPTISPIVYQLYDQVHANHQMYTTLSPIILPTSPVVHQLYSNCITSFTNNASIVIRLYHQLMCCNCTPIVHQLYHPLCVNCITNHNPTVIIEHCT